MPMQNYMDCHELQTSAVCGRGQIMLKTGIVFAASEINTYCRYKDSSVVHLGR